MTYWKYIHLTELSEAVCSSWAVSKMTRYLTAAWYVASRGIDDYHSLTIDMSRYAFKEQYINVMYLQREYYLFGCIYRHIDDCNVFSSCRDVFDEHIGDFGLFWVISEAVCSSGGVSKMIRSLTAAWYVASRGIEDYPWQQQQQQEDVKQYIYRDKL